MHKDSGHVISFRVVYHSSSHSIRAVHVHTLKITLT